MRCDSRIFVEMLVEIMFICWFFCVDEVSLLIMVFICVVIVVIVLIRRR